MGTKVWLAFDRARNAAKAKVQKDLEDLWPEIEEQIVAKLDAGDLTMPVRCPEYADPAKVRYFADLLQEKIVSQGLPSGFSTPRVDPDLTNSATGGDYAIVDVYFPIF